CESLRTASEDDRLADPVRVAAEHHRCRRRDEAESTGFQLILIEIDPVLAGSDARKEERAIGEDLTVVDRAALVGDQLDTQTVQEDSALSLAFSLEAGRSRHIDSARIRDFDDMDTARQRIEA